MKKLFSFIVLVASCFTGYAQEQLTLKCEQVGEIKTEEKLSSDEGWLMLTSDVYILNPEAFKGQLEAIYPAKKEKDKIKNVFISMQMPSLSVASEVRYPLYNLNVDFVNKELQINKTNTQNKIRIVDNVPIKSSSVDVKFSAEVLNADQSGNLFQFATRQLSQIGKVKNDYSAMNSVSEEIGKLISTKMKEQQFVFNSTVSLFGEMDVERKLYSIALYEFAPSNKDIERNFSNDRLKKCIANNDKVDYSVVRNSIAKKTAPMIVVVNYKSMHKPDVRKANQLTDDYVNERIVKVQNLYVSKAMNQDVYDQEDKLNEFMKKYLEFDKETKRYKEGKVKGDKRIAPNVIIDCYYDLMNTMVLKNVKKEYLYETKFKSHYEDIMSTATSLLKDGKELETIEKLVNVLVMDRDVDTISSAKKVQENFNILYNSKSFVEDTKWEITVDDLINNYEVVYFDKLFKDRLERLNVGEPRNNEAYCQQLKKEIEDSNCGMCVSLALELYIEPFEAKINDIKAEELKAEEAAKKAEAKAKAKAKAAAAAKKKKK